MSFIKKNLLGRLRSRVKLTAQLSSQRVLLFCADKVFSVYFFIRKNEKQRLHRTFVVGVNEIAKNIHYLKKTLRDSYSVTLIGHPYYRQDYDFDLCKSKFLAGLSAPVLLAYLSNISNVFIYIWKTGFMVERKYDFIYLKKKGKKIVTIFVGDDIRSIKRCKEHFKILDMDCHCNYYKWINASFDTDLYEDEKKELAEIADKYSDVIVGSKYGQFSYITRRRYPFTYMIDVDEFNFHQEKFERMKRVTVLHAPSSPFIKGTPLVRAAIKKLRIEGFRFEYIELVDVPNTEVRDILLKSHVVLNQFYGLNPGLFGIEAMAAGNAVLMSADPDLNPELPDEGRDAWIVTHYWEIYDKLKMLFENRELIKEYAMRGRAFIETHYTFDKAREYFFDIFRKEGVL